MPIKDLNNAFDVASDYELTQLTIKDNISDEEVVELIDNGQRGACELYAHYFRDIRRVVVDEKRWYRRVSSGFWEKDNNGVEINDVSGVLSKILKDRSVSIRRSHGKSKAKEIADLSKKLQERSGAQNTLFFAQYPMGFNAANWDSYTDGFLACENGIITKDGKLRSPEVDDNALNKSPVEFKGIKTPAPLWEKTLDSIFDGDKEVIAFVQRLFGYIVSGEVTERVMPIFYGPIGNNGKSLIANIIGDVLGEKLFFGTSASKLMAANFVSDRNSPDHFVFGLRGKRLVFASEGNKDVSLDSGFVKNMTGNDMLSARASHARDSISWRPTHTVIMATNDLPSIDGEDAAMWKRLLPVEFKVTFVEHPAKPNERKMDMKLQDKILASERSGIVAWLLTGYLDWKKNGLQVPQSVEDSKRNYHSSEDVIGQFIKTMDTSDPNATISAAELYRQFKAWCFAEDVENQYSRKTFPQYMMKRFDRTEERTGYVFHGIQSVFGI